MLSAGRAGGAFRHLGSEVRDLLPGEVVISLIEVLLKLGQQPLKLLGSCVDGALWDEYGILHAIDLL